MHRDALVHHPRLFAPFLWNVAGITFSCCIVRDGVDASAIASLISADGSSSGALLYLVWEIGFVVLIIASNLTGAFGGGFNSNIHGGN